MRLLSSLPQGMPVQWTGARALTVNVISGSSASLNSKLFRFIAVPWNKLTLNTVYFEIHCNLPGLSGFLTHWDPVTLYGVKGFCHHWHSWCPGAEPAPGHHLCQCSLIISTICGNKNNFNFFEYSLFWRRKSTLKWWLFMKSQNPPGPNGISSRRYTG